ncbi:hypothetical protein CRM22_002047 [Opisthorchis felineus]|uniref:Uncharacterized protein n=1 Tax=Opisthorchis felineus TaxID=147828 RepID=A0A4S2M869_OPIFE|nr:hypothetical protein CRM22_002047 [Opisthorchis felineus]
MDGPQVEIVSDLTAPMLYCLSHDVWCLYRGIAGRRNWDVERAILLRTVMMFALRSEHGPLSEIYFSRNSSYEKPRENLLLPEDSLEFPLFTDLHFVSSFPVHVTYDMA